MKLTTRQAMLRASRAEAVGEFTTAVKIYRNILKKNPNHNSAKENLSELLKISNGQKTNKRVDLAHQKKQISRVEKLCRTGKLKQAELLCKQLIFVSSESDILYGALGSILYQKGEALLAIESYDKAISLNSGTALHHLNKALALESLNRLDESLKSLNKGLHLNPANPKAYLDRASLYRKKGKLKEAFADCDRVLKIDAVFAEAHNDKGILYEELGNLREALRCYQRAIAIKPSSAYFHYNKALAHTAMGHIKEAIYCHEKAVELNPRHSQAYHCLMNLSPVKPNDQEIRRLNSIIGNPNTTSFDKVNFLFALAKIYDNTQDYNTSFSYLEKGNSYQSELINYNFQNYINTFNKIKELSIDIQSPNPKRPLPHRPQKPIFIVGMPRSGTSLVEQILASHHKVHGAGELSFIRELITPIFESSKSHKHNNRNTVSENQKLESFNKGYYDKISSLDIHEPYFTDKMPHNFMFVGFILSALPEAKIIHCRRDPIATCWSNYKTLFSHKGNSYAYNLKSLGAYFRLYEDLMSFWHKKLPGKIYDLSYENLTKYQEIESKKLLDFCNLEWQEECLNFHKTERVVKTASASQVRKEIYLGSSDEWKRYERHLSPLIKILEGGNASESSK